MERKFIQDGEDFYYVSNGMRCHISYPGFVKNGDDLEGAMKAREAFFRDFPEFRDKWFSIQGCVIKKSHNPNSIEMTVVENRKKYENGL